MVDYIVNLKKDACIALGYDYEIWCFNGKGEKIDISEQSKPKQNIIQLINLKLQRRNYGKNTPRGSSVDRKR